MPVMMAEPGPGTEVVAPPAAPAKRGSRVPPLFHFLGQSLSITALALASYLAISHFFLESVTVVGGCMTPTLHDAQRYLLNRWVYHFRPPHRSDVILLRDPSDNGFSVKRIIGVG